MRVKLCVRRPNNLIVVIVSVVGTVVKLTKRANNAIHSGDKGWSLDGINEAMAFAKGIAKVLPGRRRRSKSALAEGALVVDDCGYKVWSTMGSSNGCVSPMLNERLFGEKNSTANISIFKGFSANKPAPVQLAVKSIGKGGARVVVSKILNE